jgi:hypothetical protein
MVSTLRLSNASFKFVSNLQAFNKLWPNFSDVDGQFDVILGLTLGSQAVFNLRVQRR